MGIDFDMNSFYENLRATKPPYECPMQTCRKIYRSYNGINQHMKLHEETAVNEVVIFSGDDEDVGGENGELSERSRLSSSGSSSPEHVARYGMSGANIINKNSLTYSKSKDIIETEINGKLHGINIHTMLKVISVASNFYKHFEKSKILLNGTITNDTDTNMMNGTLSKTPTKKPRGSAAKPRRVTTKLISKMIIKPEPPVLLDACVTIVEDPIRVDTVANIWKLFLEDKEEDDTDFSNNLYRFSEKTTKEKDQEIEYDMDDEDYAWLELVNERRIVMKVPLISPENFEFFMDRFEKEAYFQSTKKTCSTDSDEQEEDTECNICMDSECQNSNVILFCDMCNLAVHQECYGVPYVPEGQWLCRRCLHSPSIPVECCLCPNGTIGAAFKRTEDARWAHVICALWIPEVGFANTVFLEPIDSLLNIPQARWRLTCYICKEKGVGACIQCHKSNCYTAFHVTCAQLAGLYMRIETTSTGTASSLRKSAFCDQHTPIDHDPRKRKTYRTIDSSNSSSAVSDTDPQEGVKRRSGSDDNLDITVDDSNIEPSVNLLIKANSKIQIRKARKILAKKRNILPTISIPIISDEKILKISNNVNIEMKTEFMLLLHKFWSLKRRSRNGVPLIRRLQSNQMSRQNKGDDRQQAEKDDITDRTNDRSKMIYLKHLRNRLECLRLLVECIRKREKTKRDLIRVQEQFIMLYLQPFNVIMLRMMSELEEKDTIKIFMQPVNLDEVEDYAAIIKQPMDFATIRANITSNKYTQFTDVETDFNLVVANCLRYNSKDTVFYKAGIKLRDAGGEVIRKYKRELDHIGIDRITGRHMEVAPDIVNDMIPKISSIEDIISKEVRKTMTLKQQLDEFLLHHDMLKGVNNRKTNLKKSISREITKLRKEISIDARFTSFPLMTMGTKRMTQNSNQSPCHSLPPRTRRSSHHLHQVLSSPDAQSPSPDALLADYSEDTIPLTTPDKEEMLVRNVVASNINRRSAVLLSKKKRISLTPLSNDSNEVVSPADLNSPKFKSSPLYCHDDVENENTDTTTAPPTKRRKCQPIKNDSAPSTTAVGKSSSSSFDPSKRVTSHAAPKHLSTPPGSPRLRPTTSQPPASFLQYRGTTAGVVHSSELDTATSDGESAAGTSSSTSSSGSGVSDNEEGRADSFSQGPFPPCRYRLISGPATATDSGGGGGGGGGCIPLSVIVDSCDTSSTTSSNRLQRRCKDQVRTKTSCWSSADEDEEIIPLHPMDLVWAKCKGYPWYPALIINPSMPKTGTFHHGVPIPVPPNEVLAQRIKHSLTDSLVLFFDAKRTWQWLPRSKLEPLGVDSGLDKAKQDVNKRANIRRNVQRAYFEAITHRCRVTGEQNPLLDDYS